MRRLITFVYWFDRVMAVLSNSFLSISFVSLWAVVFVIMSYVLLRTFTEITIYFVEEWTAYLLVLIACFPALHTLRTKGHVTMDIVSKRFSPMTSRIVQLISGLIGICVIGFCIWRSLDYFVFQLAENIHSVNVTRTPMWIPTLFVPLGLTVFGLGMLEYSLQKVVEVVNCARKRNVLPSKFEK